jgi:hypothetical protein
MKTIVFFRTKGRQSTDKTTDKTTDETSDMTTSHLTNPAKYAGQVIGYSHPTKQPAEELLAGHPKDGGQVAGYIRQAGCGIDTVLRTFQGVSRF